MFKVGFYTKSFSSQGSYILRVKDLNFSLLFYSALVPLLFTTKTNVDRILHHLIPKVHYWFPNNVGRLLLLWGSASVHKMMNVFWKSNVSCWGMRMKEDLPRITTSIFQIRKRTIVCYLVYTFQAGIMIMYPTFKIDLI